MRDLLDRETQDVRAAEAVASPVRFDGLDHGVTEEVDEPAQALRGKGLGSN